MNKRFLGALIAGVTCGVMIGCASHPYGLSDREWRTLSSREQAETKLRFEQEKAARQYSNVNNTGYVTQQEMEAHRAIAVGQHFMPWMR